MSIRIVDGSGNWQDVTDIRVVDTIGGTPTWKRIQKAMVVDDTGKWQDAFVFDQTGPSAATSRKSEWKTVSSAPQVTVTWTNPTTSDFSYTEVYRLKSTTLYDTTGLTGLSNASWGSAIVTRTGVGTAQSYTDTFADGALAQVDTTTYGANRRTTQYVYYRFIPYDTRGNAGTISFASTVGNGTSTVRHWYRSPFYLEPTDGGTWRGSSWRADSFVQDGAGGYTRTVQSMPSSPGDLNWGFYFYATRPSSGFINATATEIVMQRNSSSGTSAAIAPQFRLSAHSSKSGDPTGSSVSSTVSGSGLTFGGSAWMSLTSDWGELIITNTTYRSINIYSATLSNYAIFFGSGDTVSGNPGGTLRLTHGG